MAYKCTFAFFTIALLLACSGQAPAAGGAEAPLADNTVTGELLQAEVPENWFKAVDKNIGELRIEEYFPPGTTDYWAQKLVLESLSSSNLPDPIVYTNGLAEQQNDRCEDFNHHTVHAGFENGFPTVVAVLECGIAKLTGKPVVTMIKAIKGNRALYTVSRIWRLEQPAAGDEELMPPATMAEFAAWSNTLQRIQACDGNLAAHPCRQP